MSFSILVPEINARPSNTKDAIISILATEWPLSLKGMFSKIRKRYGYASSYQAVYKAAKELLDLQVLVENDKKYEINVAWVKRVQSFTDIVETNYYAKERVQSLSGIGGSKQNKDILVLNFENIFDAEKYLYYFMKSELLKSKNDTICYTSNHEWRPMLYLRTEYNYYRRLTKRNHKFYFICAGSSDIEKLCAEFYKKIGLNFKLVKEPMPHDTLVFGEYCIHIFIPEDKKKEMALCLAKKDVITLLKDVLEGQATIRVVINRDSALASEIRKQTITRFKSLK